MKKLKNEKYILGDNVNIAVFSDLHFSKNFNFNIFLNIFKNLSKNNPDYICIVGDIIDSIEVLENEVSKQRLISFFKKISKIAPVIFVTGNHDYFTGKDSKIFVDEKFVFSNTFFVELSETKNIYYLNNENVTFDKINFIGMEIDPNYYNNENNSKTLENKVRSIKKFIDNEKYNVLLFHSPINLIKKNIFNSGIELFDLVLCGHMHKGLMFGKLNKLKGNRGLISPKRTLFPKYARGLVNCDNNKTSMVISSGITTFSETAKFLNKLDNYYYSSIEYVKVL